MMEVHNKRADTSTTQTTLPARLDGLDTSFLSSNVSPKRSITPVGPIQKKVSGTINLCTNSSPEEVEEVANRMIKQVKALINRATRRSFNETGAGTVVNVDSGKSEIRGYTESLATN